MSISELKRAGILARVKAGDLTRQPASEWMGVSYRHAKRLGRRFRQQGAPGLQHRSVGRRSTRLTLPANADSPIRSAFGKRKRLERSVDALFDLPNARELAAQFVTEVAVLYEWEGMASSALVEANSALEFLKRHSATPLAPFVHFFVAHRYVCADEMPFGKLEGNQKQKAAEGVKSELALARRTSNPLVMFVVEDFARRPRCHDNLDIPR